MNPKREELTQFAEGVWVGTAPASIVGMPLTTTMTILRLRDDSLLLHSPTAMTPERLAAVRSLGEVTHLYAPSLTHQRRIGEWADTFPNAQLHAPPGLAKKRPDLRIDRVHETPMAPEMEGVLKEFPIAGFRLEETVVMYQPSQVLIVADLVHNIGRPDDQWTKIYAGLMGFYGRVGLSRVIRWTSFSDRKAARSSIDRVLAQSFDSVVIGHGTHLKTGGHEAIRAAYSWLS
ncbi:MAG: DUF4336 domain-containing protein [Deltaproteobacteria bacterium]|nr:DUF4336 domain-containing protein [Deltaproteobacteria bacterium]